MTMAGETLRFQRSTWSSTTLSTTNPIWTTMELYLGICSKKQWKTSWQVLENVHSWWRTKNWDSSKCYLLYYTLKLCKTGQETPQNSEHRKGAVFPAHTMNGYRGCRHTAPVILTSALDTADWSTSHPGHFTAHKESWYQLNRRLTVPMTGLDILEKRKIPSQTIKPAA